MKKFKVTFIKHSPILGTAKKVVELAEQEYLIENSNLDIQIPSGYEVLSVTAYLDTITQTKNITDAKKITN